MGSGDDGIGRDARVGETVKELMRRYFPSEAAPLGRSWSDPFTCILARQGVGQ